MRQISWVAAVLFLFSSLCYPQDATPTDPDTIRQMVQQVKDLQERVRILESPQSHADVSIPTSPNLPIPSVELAERAAPAPDSAQELHEVHGIQWQGSESSITRS